MSAGAFGPADAAWLTDEAEAARNAPAAILASFAPKIAALALNLALQARQHDAAVTPDVESVHPEGWRFAKFERRTKSPESIARKIRDQAETRDISEKAAASNVNDALRYTLVSPVEDGFADGIRATTSALTNKGYTVTRQPLNSFRRGMRYMGFHVSLTGGDAFEFEIQFHTEESFEVKKGTDDLYARQRSLETPRADRDQLEAEMIAMSS